MREHELERELQALGRALDIADGPDAAPAVLRRLAGQPARLPWPVRLWQGLGELRERAPLPRRTATARSPHQRRWPRLAAALVAALLVGLFAGSPQVRAAVAQVVRLVGIEVRWGSDLHDSGASTAPRPSGQSVGDAAEASRIVGFPVPVPAQLGAPDEVRVWGPSVVTLLYRAGEGRPAPGPDGVAASLDVFDGDLDPGFVKLARTQPEYVDVGEEGYWFSTPHEVRYRDEAGAVRAQPARRAERTLIWRRAGMTYRLEGAFTRDQAIAVARSLP